jgi:hypothetical protein
VNLDLVIAQCRQYCAPLQGRVGGAADFDIGTEHIVAFTDSKGALVYPSAVVMPLDDEATDLDPMAGPAVNQMVTERVGVIVEFDATADRRGQGGVDQVQAMKYALHGALLNWNPDPAHSTNGLRYGGGALLAFDRARLFWRYEYVLAVQLTDGDGYSIFGDPLIEIVSTFNTLDPPIVFTASATDVQPLRSRPWWMPWRR